MDIHARFLYEEEIFHQLEVRSAEDDLQDSLEPEEEWEDDLELADDLDAEPIAHYSLTEDDHADVALSGPPGALHHALLTNAEILEDEDLLTLRTSRPLGELL